MTKYVVNSRLSFERNFTLTENNDQEQITITDNKSKLNLPEKIMAKII